jgi:alpha-amylase
VPINERGEPITDWSDVMDLDYGNPETRKAMIAAMQYWIKTCDIDGYRVDMAGLVPNDFWKELRPALDTLKPVLMIAEWQDEPEHFNSCFSVNYGWKWKDFTKDIWAGKKTAKSLDSLLTELNDFYPKGYTQLYFTQNHDENTWNGTEKELYGASAEAFNVLAFTWQGVPMLYNGQEDDLNKRLKFFERDPIRWKSYARTAFFQRLCTLRHDNKSLRAGLAGGNIEKIETGDDAHIYAFTREKEGDRVVIVANLSRTPRTATLSIDSRIAGAYANVFGASTMQLTRELHLNLKPWEYLVLSNR